MSRRLKIGGMPYKLSWVSKDTDVYPGEEAWGAHSASKSTITVLNTLTKEHQQKILIHELIHAVIHNRGIKELGYGETHLEAPIDQLSGGLFEALNSLGVTLPYEEK